jgi:hypothetical protein
MKLIGMLTGGLIMLDKTIKNMQSRGMTFFERLSERWRIGASMQTRYGKEAVSPGRKMPEKAEIQNFNQPIQDEWNRLQNRRQELQTRIREIEREERQLMTDLGHIMAEGADWREYGVHLSTLRLEGELVELGISCLDGQLGIMKRNNYWLKS